MAKDYKNYTLEELTMLKERYIKDIEAYKDMLKALPADTFLGRFGINADIKLTRRKLDDVLEAISTREISFGRKKG